MQKMIILVRGNIKKNKGQMISMLLIIIVAALLLNIGALSFYNFGLFFDEKAEQLNAPHVTIFISKDAYRPAHEDFLRSDPPVTQTNTEEVLYMPGCCFAFGDGKLAQNIIFQNAGLDRDMAPLSIVVEEAELAKNSLYAPYILQSGGGYELGDTITLEYMNQEYDFRISGFVEDIMLGSTNMSIIGFYMPEPLYKRFMADGLALPAVMLSAQLTDQRLSDDVVEGYNAFFSEEDSVLGGMPITLVKLARSFSANIAAMIIVAFALIIISVALIVIRFRISDNIRDDIKDIGALKAVGFTSRQVKTVILLQFLGITTLGSLLGIAISYLAVPMLSTIFSAQTGLPWHQGFAPATSAVCLAIILIAVAINVLHSSRQLNSLEPIIAISGDMKTRSFKKNFFRLEKTKGNLQFILARKLIMQKLGQNIMIALIIAAVTFASAFGLVLFYNMAVNTDIFIGTVAGEVCSLGVSSLSNLNTARLCEEIGAMQGVRKAIIFDDIGTIINEEAYVASITEDFSELEGQLLYFGSYPQSADEVAVGGAIIERYGKTVGDTVVIRKGNKDAEYIISGLIQSGNNIGRIMLLTTEGVKRIMPDYLPSFIYVYLHEGEDAAAFISLLEDRFGSVIDTPVNLDDLIKGVVGSYLTIIMLMAIIILFITGFIVTLILYFVIKTMISQRRRDFGVQKAVGFTTFQLVQQISLSFMPIVAAGSITGIIAGYLWISPLVSALFRSTGIMKFDMIIAHLWLAILCVGIAVFSYIIAIIISSRTRKISAYSLVTK